MTAERLHSATSYRTGPRGRSCPPLCTALILLTPDAPDIRVLVVWSCGFVAALRTGLRRLDAAAFGLAERVTRGTLPRSSAYQARHAAEGEREDRLTGCAAGEMQLDLGFEFD